MVCGILGCFLFIRTFKSVYWFMDFWGIKNDIFCEESLRRDIDKRSLSDFFFFGGLGGGGYIQFKHHGRDELC